MVIINEFKVRSFSFHFYPGQRFIFTKTADEYIVDSLIWDNGQVTSIMLLQPNDIKLKEGIIHLNITTFNVLINTNMIKYV